MAGDGLSWRVKRHRRQVVEKPTTATIEEPFQTEIAKTIVDEGGDCVLALKDNQGHLFEDV
jgi:hypothetical protein